MSRRFWIRLRILGWVLMLCWFLFYEIIILLNLFNPQLIGLMNGLMGGIGTLSVLLGYYELTKHEV